MIGRTHTNHWENILHPLEIFGRTVDRGPRKFSPTQIPNEPTGNLARRGIRNLTSLRSTSSTRLPHFSR